jgi:hypothetical protein
VPCNWNRRSGLPIPTNKVPFSFTVGEQTLPAGNYFVEGLAWNAVAFQPAEGKAGLIRVATEHPAYSGDHCQAGLPQVR